MVEFKGKIFDGMGSFMEERAWVLKNGLWYHVRIDGEPAYPERYYHVSPFANGRSLALDQNGKSFYIDRDGKIINCAD